MHDTQNTPSPEADGALVTLFRCIWRPDEGMSQLYHIYARTGTHGRWRMALTQHFYGDSEWFIIAAFYHALGCGLDIFFCLAAKEAYERRQESHRRRMRCSFWLRDKALALLSSPALVRYHTRLQRFVEFPRIPRSTPYNLSLHRGCFTVACTGTDCKCLGTGVRQYVERTCSIARANAHGNCILWMNHEANSRRHTCTKHGISNSNIPPQLYVCGLRHAERK